MLETYNQYVTKGIQDGTISYREVDGVRCYQVRRPHPNEEVVGYTNFSGIFGKETDTQRARREGESAD